MSIFDDDSMSDEALDAIEDEVAHLPPAPLYAPYLASRFGVWLLGRRLEKSKKRAVANGEAFSAKATVDLVQPLAGVGGWISVSSHFSPEFIAAAKELLTDRFDQRNLKVDDFKLGLMSFSDGADGTYSRLRAWFTVS